MADEYAVHDVVVKDSQNFSPAGAIISKTQVTFYVGVHGPFLETFDKGAATGAAIQSAIDTQVRMLRAIAGTTQAAG